MIWGLHRDFFILAFLGIMFDAADFAFFGTVLPPIAREFGLRRGLAQRERHNKALSV